MIEERPHGHSQASRDSAGQVLQEIREAQAEHPHAKRFVRRRGRLVPESTAAEIAATTIAIARLR